MHVRDLTYPKFWYHPRALLKRTRERPASRHWEHQSVVMGAVGAAAQSPEKFKRGLGTEDRNWRTTLNAEHHGEGGRTHYFRGTACAYPHLALFYVKQNVEANLAAVRVAYKLQYGEPGQLSDDEQQHLEQFHSMVENFTGGMCEHTGNLSRHDLDAVFTDERHDDDDSAAAARVESSSRAARSGRAPTCSCARASCWRR